MSRPTMTTTRTWLAVLITAAVLLLATLGVTKPEALPVLDKMLPVLTLVIGYYFGQKASR
ncbi:MAG TPA: hypothetical protein VFS21_02455 [Roseiflexaceae bacterium]|nr:hypothetical protein [Roseiflexaceae bacterium]